MRTTTRLFLLVGSVFALLGASLFSPVPARSQTLEFNCATVTEIPPGECEALVALYHSTNGDQWTNRTDWLTTSTPLTWYGLMGSDGHVNRISLFDNNLTGSIPPEIGNFSQLSWLTLYTNHLTGSVPPQIGNLGQLISLNLRNNQLVGSIPPELANLSQLDSLDLSGNRLTGSIPAALGNLTLLSGLSLNGNQLTGSIPPELGNLNRLFFLSLRDNHLSGSIPPGIGNLPDLTILELDNNLLTGNIPPEFANLTHVCGLAPGDYFETCLNLGYNLLNVPTPYPSDPPTALELWLGQKDRDWYLTQGMQSKWFEPTGGTLVSHDGSVAISLPAGAFYKSVYLELAQQEVPGYGTGDLIFAGNGFVLTAKDVHGTPVTEFDKPISITLSYPGPDLAGIDEASVMLWYWDVSSSEWKDAAQTCSPALPYARDLVNHTIAVGVCHLTEFALLGSPAEPEPKIFLPLLLR